jgi:hypothetical protein
MRRVLTMMLVAVLAAAMSLPAPAKGPKGPKGPKGNNGNHYGWYKGGWDNWNPGYPPGNRTYYGPNFSYGPWGGYYDPYGYYGGYGGWPNYYWYDD